MSDLVKWVVGILFTLVLASFGYTNRVDNLVDGRIDKAEGRWVERLDRLESKLDRLLERR